MCIYIYMATFPPCILRMIVLISVWDLCQISHSSLLEMPIAFDVSNRSLFKRQMVLPLPGNQRWVPQFQRKVIDVRKKTLMVMLLHTKTSPTQRVGGQERQLNIGGAMQLVGEVCRRPIRPSKVPFEIRNQ